MSYFRALQFALLFLVALCFVFFFFFFITGNANEILLSPQASKRASSLFFSTQRSSPLLGPLNVTAVLPTTMSESNWLSNILSTCESTPSRTRGGLLVVVPDSELSVARDLLVGFLWAVAVSETYFVPELNVRRISLLSGWFKQQLIKLFAYRRVESEYVLFMDADNICTLPSGGGIASMLEMGDSDITVRKRRLHTCMEPLDGWYGSVQYQRSAETLKLEATLEKSDAAVGWTPQLLSTEGCKVAVEFLLGHLGMDLEEFMFLGQNGQWTEYAAYFLGLRAAGRWDEFHTEIHAGPIDGGKSSMSSALAMLRGTSQKRGCGHVRVNDIDALKRELQVGQVPFIMCDDHKITAEAAAKVIKELSPSYRTVSNQTK
jgi:hypothetical protein